MGFLPTSRHVSTIVWFHHLDFNEVPAEKAKWDGSNTRKLHTVLDKSQKQQPRKQQLYSHLPPISQTIQVK